MVAFELEVLAKKTDRFGWERDRGTPAHDRLMMDWMDTLQDFPLTEVQAACKAAVIANPKSTPNEGHVFAQIMAARAAQVAATKRHAMPPPDLARKLLSVEERRLIALRAGLPDLSGLAKEFPKSGEVSS